jgi:hypothetical protein
VPTVVTACLNFIFHGWTYVGILPIDGMVIFGRDMIYIATVLVAYILSAS